MNSMSTRTQEQLDQEERQFEEETGYTVAELFDLRRVTVDEVHEADANGTARVCVKVPSASEVYVSTELARRVLDMEPF